MSAAVDRLGEQGPDLMRAISETDAIIVSELRLH